MSDFPTSLGDFQRRYPDKAACAAWLFTARWPAGFRCPACAHEKGWPHGGKPFTFECAACGKQTSVTAGTLMHGVEVAADGLVLGGLSHGHPFQRHFGPATPQPTRHPPGEQALSDFTDASSLAVTIDGAPFPHLLYHFWLAFSGWQYVKAIQGGESFTALTEVCRKRCGNWAGRLRHIAPTGCRQPTAICVRMTTRRPATGRSATTTACSRPATIRVSAMRTAASRRRTAISRPACARPSSCAAAATSPTSPSIRHSSPSSCGRRTRAAEPRCSWS